MTNNGIEQFFRRIRRCVRKRYGNIATGKHMLMDTAKEKMMKDEL
jgi:transposase-like protein